MIAVLAQLFLPSMGVSERRETSPCKHLRELGCSEIVEVHELSEPTKVVPESMRSQRGNVRDYVATQMVV
jgi:hypothetical protein